jgi:protoporphyrinogen IX oxidase
LFSVVFLVIVKSALNWIFGVLALFLLAVLLMLGIRLYKRIRDKNPEA